jgi:hydrogenase-1 operon protein HyaF
MNAFPIPVVAAVGPGSQPEDEVLDYLALPQGMATFRAPLLPEPEDAQRCTHGQRALHAALAALDEVRRDGVPRRIDLLGLPAADLALINQVLGEGEVSAVVQADEANGADAAAALGTRVQVQESVFAGVWRVVHTAGGRVVADAIELGAVPQALREAALADVQPPGPAWAGALPPQVQNAPALLAEITDQWRAWQPGAPAHVVNLTLLPMTVEDIGFLDHHLGTGRVLILSRGYGNCRITNTRRPHCWRVVYYNSQDVVILNTVEVGDLPAVAQAAAEDLADSFERLTEVLAWVDGGGSS